MSRSEYSSMLSFFSTILSELNLNDGGGGGGAEGCIRSSGSGSVSKATISRPGCATMMAQRVNANGVLGMRRP